MILKYTLRMIKSTLNRFMAILAIVFIGVSFMMGLRSNYNIMKDSVEGYYDNNNLYDIQMYSNIGFEQNDVDAISKLDYVSDVYASKTRDTYASNARGSEFVARLIEIDSSQNQVELLEGRMPKSSNECLAVPGYMADPLSIGDTFNVYFKDGNDINDTVKNSIFTIVGTVAAPEHMSKTFSTSLLDNNQLGLVAFIPNENFVSEYYTCLYVKLTGAEEINSFNEAYKEFVDEKITLLEDFSLTQSQEFKNKIIEQATIKLEEGRAELEENRAKYQAEFDAAKKKLDDGKKKLDNALKQIEDNEKKLKESEVQLKEAQKEVDAGYKELLEKEQQLIDAEAQLAEYGSSPEELLAEVTSLYETYQSTKASLDELNAQRAEIESQLAASQALVSKYSYSSSTEVRNVLVGLDPTSDEYAELIEVYNAWLFIETSQNQLDQIDTKITVISTTLNTIESTMQSEYGMSVEEGYNYIVEAVSLVQSGRVQIQEAYSQLGDAQQQITDGYKQIEDGKAQLEKGKKDYDDGVEEYEKGLKEYEEGLEKFELEMQNAQDKLDDGEKQIADLQDIKWHILNRYDTNYAFYMYRNTCEQMKSIGVVIPILFFAVAAFVCSTTMTRLIDEQRGQIGIYRALGFRKKEINSIYLLYVVLASLAASVVAVFVGIAMFPTIIYSTWRLMYELPGIQLSMPIDNLILCVSCFTVLMMSVTYVVVRKSLKETTAQLLRPKPPKNTKQTLIEKWTWLWNKFGFTTKVTARNILRYKSRFIMTIIGIAGCTSLLLMGFGIKDSVTSAVSLQYKDVFKFDYQVMLSNDRHIDQIVKDIVGDNNVEGYVPYGYYNTAVSPNGKDTTIQIIAVNEKIANTVFTFTDEKTDKVFDLPKEGAILSDKFANTYDIKVGDEIEIYSYTGTPATAKVVGIMKNYVMSYIYMSETYYESLFGEDVEYTQIGIVSENGSDKLVELVDKYNDVSVVNNISQATKSFNDMFEALNLIIVVIIIVAGALAFVVLINLTNINISERIREIATLKVLGFRKGEVNAYIFKEVVLMTIVGAIIGLPLGEVEEKYILGVIDMEMVKFPSVIYPISYLYVILITAVFTIIVLFITKKTLNNVEMVESLKSIE